MQVLWPARRARLSSGALVPALLIAAIAERAGLGVPHQDKDFDLISQITDQPTERLNG